MPRPRSITIIAWLFVGIGVAGLLNDLWPLLTSGSAAQLAKLKSDGLADLGPAWTTRLLAIVAGIWLLRGRNWARWLLVLWMLFHIGLSVLDSWEKLVIHCVIFLPIFYFLFRESSQLYFRSAKTSAA
jgi:hypothetical protein